MVEDTRIHQAALNDYGLDRCKSLLKVGSWADSDVTSALQEMECFFTSRIFSNTGKFSLRLFYSTIHFTIQESRKRNKYYLFITIFPLINYFREIVFPCQSKH